MSDIVKITGVLENDIFASHKAILISENSITAEASGEGKSSLVKTANKGDEVYVDSKSINSALILMGGFVIGNEYEFNYVQSLYAKNIKKPLVLSATTIQLIK